MEEEKPMKKRLALLLALVMTLSLCACGSAAKSADHAPAAGNSVYASESSAAYDAAPMAAEEAYWEGDADYGFSVSDNTSSSAAETDVPDENPEKIIYSADVTVETTDFDASLQTLDKLVKEYGGWV